MRPLLRVLRGSSLWGAAVLTLASACGGHVGHSDRSDAEGGLTDDAIAPVAASSPAGTPSGSAPGAPAGPVASNSDGAVSPSAGPASGSPSPGTVISEEASCTPGVLPTGPPDAAFSAPGTNCVPAWNGSSNGGGSCESEMVNECNGTRYQVICSCPQRQCACFGPTTQI